MFSYILTFCLFILLALAGAVVWTTKKARRSAAPFFPTPKRAIREGLRAAGLKPDETFYDLGTGTGRALVIAEKEFGARATGLELSWLFYLIAKINVALHGMRADVELRDLWDTDLKDVDVVFPFLAERVMPKLEEKLKRELKPGARIIIYAFPLPNLKPETTIVIRGQWKLFIYKL
jgi:cyclopropane fatty-acyl-phospholipid synthase-like methyltransferase